MNNWEISENMTIKLEDIFRELPKLQKFDNNIRRAPKRYSILNEEDKILALKNALRYIPEKWHKKLAPEFMQELKTMGRIYGYRFRPQGRTKGLSIELYKGKCIEGKAFQVMIDNNLDFDTALYPYELVTYGETGQVCQNWMQYRLIKAYLEIMTSNQTLSILSGHSLGLFKSSSHAPRVMITNGLMTGLFDDQENFNRAAALGVANYGQMTAGGWMYIGPQGIVHGTYSTLLNAARIKLGISKNKNMQGVVFVSSGLGGMSGAQGKACEIAGGVGIIAEVDYSRIKTRYEQGWVTCVANDLEDTFNKAEKYIKEGIGACVAFHGNIVDLLLYAVENEKKIDLVSDQTSCHVVYEGGYCPQGLTFEQRTLLLKNDPEKFKNLVNISLKKHFEIIKTLVKKGVYFFDYGNSFMKAVFDAGETDICKNKKDTKQGFIFPSYVEDIMGPLLFDYGYGPFRWVCLSGKNIDLEKTDAAAMECIDINGRFQDRDNYFWIKNAGKNKLVVGTKARILYQDALGRIKIALKFNKMIRNKEIGAVMLGRDHHDTGGTDSPFRETANIKDGSNIMADMATISYAGNAARGMSLVALHNGGGVGIGNAINGGFGLVLDGSKRIDDIIKKAISWDVMSGVARRAWARCENAVEVAAKYNQMNKNTDHITLPYTPDHDYITKLVRSKTKE